MVGWPAWFNQLSFVYNLKMSAGEISNFVKNLHLLALPSTLWAAHIDPKQEFVAIVHVNEKISIDKAILLTCENSSIKASVSLNDEIVQIPSATSKIETVSDLNSLIYSLHEVKFCVYANSGFAKCAKYILSSDNSGFCDSCAFEVFRNAQQEEGEVPADDCLQEPEPQEAAKPDKDSFLCTVCGKTLANSSGLDEHMLTHAPPSDKPFKCKVCTKAFAKKYNLNVHVRVHSGERPYVCSKCGKTYSTRSNLSTHMNSAHCEEKRHHCELCEMSFVHPRVLRIHMRKHTGEKPFKCQVCAKSFSKNVHLTIHMRTHTGEKPYVCQACGKGFTTTGNLNSHRKISSHQ